MSLVNLPHRVTHLNIGRIGAHERPHKPALLLIEAETSNHSGHFPFYLTDTEPHCSRAASNRFQLYRVFDCQRRARVYVLHGDLKQSRQLDPVAYRAGMAG